MGIAACLLACFVLVDFASLSPSRFTGTGRAGLGVASSSTLRFMGALTGRPGAEVACCLFACLVEVAFASSSASRAARVTLIGAEPFLDVLACFLGFVASLSRRTRGRVGAWLAEVEVADPVPVDVVDVEVEVEVEVVESVTEDVGVEPKALSYGWWQACQPLNGFRRAGLILRCGMHPSRHRREQARSQ